MHSPLEQFQIKPLIPIHFGNFDLSFTNSSVFMLLSLVSIFMLLTIGVRKLSLIPSRLQSANEMLFELVEELVIGTSGTDGRKYIPFIFSIFMFILTCNLLGMIPGSFAVTTHIAVTFAMAIVVFLGITLIGIIRHGFHFLSLFVPQGTPIWLMWLIIPIEVFSYFIRPFSLSLRLAANITAGHIVMKVIASFVLMLGVFGVVPLALLTLLTGFEIVVAILQAYIFTILSCIYLSDAIKLH
jgi:F-type H+-transporting ATPase subunit a